MALCDAGDAGHDLTRRAIATLEAIALDECGLQRMEPLAFSQALDGRDLAPVYEGSKREARFDAFAIHQDRAGAALAEATAFLRACQMQVLAQRIEERSARIERQPVLGSVDAQHDVEGSGRGAGCAAVPWRRLRGRCVGYGMAGVHSTGPGAAGAAVGRWAPRGAARRRVGAQGGGAARGIVQYTTDVLFRDLWLRPDQD